MVNDGGPQPLPPPASGAAVRGDNGAADAGSACVCAAGSPAAGIATEAPGTAPDWQIGPGCFRGWKGQGPCSSPSRHGSATWIGVA